MNIFSTPPSSAAISVSSRFASASARRPSIPPYDKANRQYRHFTTHRYMTRSKDGVATFYRPLVDSGYPELIVITHYAPPGSDSMCLSSVLDRDDGNEVDDVEHAEEREGTSRVPMHVEFRVYPGGSLTSPAELSSTSTASSISVARYMMLALFLAPLAITLCAAGSGMMRDHLRFSVIAMPGIGIQLETKKGHRLPPWPRPRFPFIKPKTSTSTPTPLINDPIVHLGDALACPSWLFTTTTTFIPLSTLRPASSKNGAADSIIIHEGLQRWSIKFYLAIMYCVKAGSGSGKLSDASSVIDDATKRGEEWKVQVMFPALQPRLPILREVYYGLREVMFEDFKDDVPQNTPDMT
ncbi:hypothetical protein QFC21_001350 [Naganishia friedmannii]|uniref:Uncharacterized protein n=1 Tax=Naganishia friedmannii TaxID=89922 RepID=A0ACC2W488_9TREE|nr:hypothetical protein QFC21_001350 [Naganishia friedmannii]